MKQTTAVIVLALTLTSVSHVTSTSCSSHANGCSVPDGLPLPVYKLMFLKDCNKHDICYACASHFGRSQADCDDVFFVRMLKTCGKRVFCKKVAFTYFVTVSLLGGEYFKKSSPSWCSESWVNDCM